MPAGATARHWRPDTPESFAPDLDASLYHDLERGRPLELDGVSG